jgi:DNA repair exonuclease SbcCD nuclease subunit
VNNILIYSDEHRCLSALKECNDIDNEIISLKEKYNCDTIISLGDNFDSTKPSSQELDQFAQFIKKLNCQIIILAANSHESTTQEESILNHYGILSNKVTIVKEYIDEKHLYCGHFSIKESTNNYDAKLSKVDFKNYLYVFLGHVHSYQLIKPNILHLGSCRYVNFDEAKDKHKIVALITDYGTETEKVHFLKLNTPIPMIELKLGKKEDKMPIPEAENAGQNPERGKESGILGVKHPVLSSLEEVTALLDKTDPKTKVKVKIMDFESFRGFLPFANKYSSKFEVFKYTTEFNVVSDLTPDSAKKQITNFKESFSNYLKTQKIDSKIMEILKKEIE